ncbi:MAG: LysR substrate-binding domain-containing protein [Pseudomonadota bacterium]
MSWDQRLRLRHLRTFGEVARFESVSLAAKELNVTQPAVSRSLRELEEMLGAPLFDRVGRGLRLNAAGRSFQSHTSSALTELSRGRDLVRKQGASGTRLSVGTLPTAASDLVPRAALAFHERLPRTRVHVMTGPNWLLFNQLREGQLDLVVGRMPDNAQAEGLHFQQLYPERVVLVCRPEHPILTVPDPEKSLINYPLILPPGGAVIAGTVARYLISVGLSDIRGQFETVALPVGRHIVMASDALWFISQGVVSEELAAKTLRSVDLASPLLSGPVGISALQSAALDPERQTFVACLREAAKR